MPARTRMKHFALCVFLIAAVPLVASAQTLMKPTDPNAALQRYATPYVNRQSQTDAMTARPAYTGKGTGAATTTLSGGNSRYLPPSPYAGTPASGGKRKKFAPLAAPARATTAKASDDIYDNNLWSSDQTYADPRLARPTDAN
jgi:hypothetical protein